MEEQITIEQAREKREMAKSLFNAFIQIIQPHLIDDTQLDTIVDAKWGVLGQFDAEICHAEHMERMEITKLATAAFDNLQ
jgi:hypothetical protein